MTGQKSLIFIPNKIKKPVNPATGNLQAFSFLFFFIFPVLNLNPLVQYPVEPRKQHKCRNRRRQNITDRFRHKDAKHLIGQNHGKNKKINGIRSTSFLRHAIIKLILACPRAIKVCW